MWQELQRQGDHVAEEEKVSTRRARVSRPHLYPSMIYLHLLKKSRLAFTVYTLCYYYYYFFF